MNTYYPDSKIPIGIWDGEAKMHYANFTVNIEFAAEPPFGDLIYRVKIGEDKLLNRWIYGRAMIFFDDRYALFESVEENTFGPINTILVDLHENKYAELDGWYDKVKSFDKPIILISSHSGEEKIIEDINSLSWIII